MEQCPVCSTYHPLDLIVEHVNRCLNEMDEPAQAIEKVPDLVDYYQDERRMQEEENERYHFSSTASPFEIVQRVFGKREG